MTESANALLALLKNSAGSMPKVNPPQADKVLQEKTSVEVAGGQAPELPPAVVPAPVEKPADVVAAEAEVKPKRTAKVVQAELDAALARIKELEEYRAGKVPLEEQLAENTSQLLSLEKALEACQQEKGAAEEANVQAAALITDLNATIETLRAQASAAPAEPSGVKPGQEGLADLSEFTTTELCAALAEHGFAVDLKFGRGL